jgi:hypothetical protein
MNPGDDFAEVLRRALHAEAESVVPTPDALDRIRARTAAKPRWSWFLADWSKPLLAAAAAVVMGAAVFSGGPAAIERITSVGQNSKAEQARQKTASSAQAEQQNSLVPVGPGGQPLPSGAARVTCEPIATKSAGPKRPPTPKITPSPVPHPAPTAVVVPTGARETAWKNLSCPPSTTPSLVPSAKPPATPVPTGTLPADPTTELTTPPVPSTTPTPDLPSTPPASTVSPSAPASSLAPTEPTPSPS